MFCYQINFPIAENKYFNVRNTRTDYRVKKGIFAPFFVGYFIYTTFEIKIQYDFKQCNNM